MNAENHWERIYTENAPDAVSWYRPHPRSVGAKRGSKDCSHVIRTHHVCSRAVVYFPLILNTSFTSQWEWALDPSTNRYILPIIVFPRRVNSTK